jgi:hypothetical protein
MIPQIIYILLTFLNLYLHSSKHGQKRKMRKYNIWMTLAAEAIMLLILYFGGFFNAIF